MKSETNRNSGIILTTASSLIWGTVFVSIGFGLSSLNPYVLVFMRFLVASIPIFFAIAFFEKRIGVLKELRKKSSWYLGIIYAISFLIQYIGQNMTNASDTALLSNLSPIIAPVGAFFMLRDRLTLGQKLALPVGLVGLVLVAGPKLSLGLTDFIGDMFLFVTSMLIALFIIMSKKMNFGSIGGSFSLIIVVLIYLAPVGLLGGLNVSTLVHLNAVGWEAILWTAIPCTLVSIVLYLKGLSAITVSESAILLLIQVITGVILADLIFGEGLDSFGIAGAILLLVAVLLSSLKLSKRHGEQGIKDTNEISKAPQN
jgi:drug/metabolite transporter (DMT)-like permease